MSERYGFFNAVIENNEPDRVYTADDINHFFKGILSDGVFRAVDNALKVEAGASGLTVKVNTGKALVNQHWYVIDTAKSVTITTAHATFNRYTAVILRYDSTKRSIGIATIDGATSSSPTPFTEADLTKTDTVYEILLANVLVNAGATSLTADKITDSRSYTSGLTDPTPLNYRRHDATVTNTNGQRYFDIPLSYNFTLDTLLQVYDNGLLCAPSEYTLQINEVEGNYMVVFPTVRAKGTEMSFIMIN